MKPLILAMTVVFSILTLMPIQGSAEPTHPNEVGLYMTPDGLGATGTFITGTPVSVYLVLTKPTDSNTGIPYASINAFELTIHFNPVPNGNLFFLEEILPPRNVDIGPNKDITLGYLDYFVGIDLNQPVWVTDESVVLVEIVFMSMATGPIEVTLGPSYAPSIPGEMVYLSVIEDLIVMHPVSGAHDDPVFIFNGEAVPVETESFGSVKALYR